MLFDMTGVKTRIGLLYEQSFAEKYKRVKTELTSRCPDVDISADVVVDNHKGLLPARTAVVFDIDKHTTIDKCNTKYGIEDAGIKKAGIFYLIFSQRMGIMATATPKRKSFLLLYNRLGRLRYWSSIET